MAEHILSMVKTANPEAIEKYVKYHLPNDQASLERIYKELLQYESKPKESKLTKLNKRSQSVQSIQTSKNASTVVFDGKNSIEQKRTNSIIKMLKDKGLKVTSNDE